MQLESRNSPEPKNRRCYKSPEESFEARTKRVKSGCLEWVGSINSKGYGLISVDAKPYLAHRYAWERKNGPIPKNRIICHHCDNTKCCDESHLFMGTAKDNMADMVAKGRSCTGTKNGRAKLNIPKVHIIRDMHKVGIPQTKIAMAFDVSTFSISDIVNGRSWKNV